MITEHMHRISHWWSALGHLRFSEIAEKPNALSSQKSTMPGSGEILRAGRYAHMARSRTGPGGGGVLVDGDEGGLALGDNLQVLEEDKEQVVWSKKNKDELHIAKRGRA